MMRVAIFLYDSNYITIGSITTYYFYMLTITYNFTLITYTYSNVS